MTIRECMIECIYNGVNVYAIGIVLLYLTLDNPSNLYKMSIYLQSPIKQF